MQKEKEKCRLVYDTYLFSLYFITKLGLLRFSSRTTVTSRVAFKLVYGPG